jgi:hypothetical protein
VNRSCPLGIARQRSLDFSSSAGASRESAFLDPLLLFEKLLDGPEEGEPEYPQERRDGLVGNQNRSRKTNKAQEEEQGPEFFTKEVLKLDHDRVENPNDGQRGHPDQEAQVSIHTPSVASARRESHYLRARGGHRPRLLPNGGA